MTNDDVIDALQAQKQQLEAQLPGLLARSQNDTITAGLKLAYSQAVQQWNDRVNKTFRTDDPMLGKLVAQLNAVQVEIAAMVAQMEDLESIFNKIASGVKIGAAIVAMVK